MGTGSSELPAGNDHGFDERHLGLRGRLIFVHEGGEKVEEAALVLAFQDDGGGEQVVTGAVGGGAAFAFGRGGAAGMGSVGPGGSDLVFGAGGLWGGSAASGGISGVGSITINLLLQGKGWSGRPTAGVHGKALGMGEI